MTRIAIGSFASFERPDGGDTAPGGMPRRRRDGPPGRPAMAATARRGPGQGGARAQDRHQS
jgi:hypothetical protein